MTRTLALVTIVLASCAAPKYQYSFDHYTVSKRSDAVAVNEHAVKHSPLTLLMEDASASAQPAMPSDQEGNTSALNQPKVNEIRYEAAAKQVALSKENKKQLVRALKEYRQKMRAMKSDNHQAATPHDQATQKLDNEVITAIAFGAVGITLSLLGGLSAAFWIAGVICLGVGVYFFIDWLQKR